jgi:ADP-heptose:LPS heptosyltransferase
MKIDAVIDCELFARISSLFSFLSRAPIKIGFHPYTQEGLYRGNFINRPVLYNPYLHISQQFLNLAYALESNTVPNAKHPPPTERLEPPQIQFSVVENERFDKKLFDDYPQVRTRRLVLVYPSGGFLPIRAWPLANYIQLSKVLIEKGVSIGVIGLPADYSLGQQIVDSVGSEYCFNLAGYTQTVRDLLLLFQHADLLITNDGGPAHLSALVETPTIVFFGPESPGLYGPLLPNTYCFFIRLACSPCLTAYNHRNSPCDGDNQCLKRIGVQDVLGKVWEMLGTDGTGSLNR